MTVTVQQVVAEGLPSVLKKRRLSRDMFKAANRIVACRTERMGSRTIYCPNGCIQRETYNSCRHRACPQCAAMARENWLHGWKQRLLACPHYHVVFTIPQELRLLWLFNKASFSKCLFAAASRALLDLLADPKYLGARPGILMAQHTWSQTLAVHPHIHAIVTAGGLTADRRWVEPVKSCLLPRKVLMIVFRGKFRSALLEAHKQGELELPPEMPEAKFRSLLNRLGRAVFNVKLLDRYEHGVGVATYLARYISGGPLGGRVLARTNDGKLRFRCRLKEPDRAARHGEIRLSATDLTLRLLEHVPPHRLQTVRAYGLYVSHYREELNVAREKLGQGCVPSQPPPRMRWQEYLECIGRTESARCCHCGNSLEAFVRGGTERSPPEEPPDRQALWDSWINHRK